MRVLKENSNENTDDGLNEFTKAEIATLFPATELLHKIHNDHVYTSTEYKLEDSYEIDDSSDDNFHHEDDVLSLNADSIQQVFQRMVNMTSLDVINDQTQEESQQESNTELHVASSAQCRPIIRKVKFVDELPGPSTDSKIENKDNRKSDRLAKRGSKRDTYSTSNRNVKDKDDISDNRSKDCPIGRTRVRSKKQGRKTTGKETNKSDEIKTCKSVSNIEWRTVNKCAEVERELHTLMQYTAELLVRRWGEYLTMTTEQISVYEIENAKQHKMVEEVIDMLEDKDRYVWQLIDELRFF